MTSKSQGGISNYLQSMGLNRWYKKQFMALLNNQLFCVNLISGKNLNGENTIKERKTTLFALDDSIILICLFFKK